MALARGLEALWASATGRSECVPLTIADRILLDSLGVGLDQMLNMLRTTTPDYAQFEAWILAVSGQPNAERIARYHAWLDGAEPPEETRNRLAAIEAMPDVFDAEALDHWEENGFVVLESAISTAEAKAAEERLWQAAGVAPEDREAWWGANRQDGILIQHFCDAELDAARHSPRVHKAFAQLWGTVDLWAKVDRMSFNPPVPPGQTWQGRGLHWDVSLVRPIPFATQAILYLTDTPANQGATLVVPGFHRRLYSWLDSLGDVDPRTVDLSAEAVPVQARAGDLVIWRHDLPHAASPNHAAQPRIAQYINMYSAALTESPVWR